MPQIRWPTFTLLIAATHNIVCGLIAAVLTHSLFAWFDLALPNYPSAVRMLGMITVIFGVGYLLAARDPVARWEIVALGLAGKLLGAFVFLGACLSQEIPWNLGLFAMANEVIWWLPFLAILLHAGRVKGSQSAEAVSSLEGELKLSHLSTGESLWDASFRQPLLIVFVRHLGCTFCREALADLQQQGERIASAGVAPVVVHMTTSEEVRPLLAHYGLKDVADVSDPDRRLFRAFDLPLGTFRQLFGWRSIWRAVMGGVVFRHGFGKIRGNPFQLTGAFLVHRGEVIRTYRNQTSADRPNYANLACGMSR